MDSQALVQPAGDQDSGFDHQNGTKEWCVF